jgi:RNA polymerase sigma-70 factor (ECF subfamily)
MIPDGQQQDSAAKILGDLLYADMAKGRASELEWVGLVHSIATRQQRALQVLYEWSHRMVFTLAMRIVNNRQTAEEVTVDVFHEVWRRAAAYDPADGTVVGWIMNQARSRAIDRLRFEERKKRTNPGFDQAVPGCEEPEPSGPQETFDLREQGHLVRNALSVLTPDERQAIEAAFFSDLTYNEVAARLNQPPGTIKTRIRSGLAKLRKALDNR